MENLIINKLHDLADTIERCDFEAFKKVFYEIETLVGDEQANEMLEDIENTYFK